MGVLLGHLIVDQILRKRFFSKVVPVFQEYLQYLRLISIPAGH